ncbi:hypothetical protein DACRYDRAFT_113429 [Dacryopinax primogenitus]|uniref:BRCT domain-containing protein n=1 Tax=Dacryopinax primogenitus (strain DJM 731) TaxID=1858805 RepID=M5G944_DACPD|nr:uncharacterized protein DACRYDRAFT_113429 [Dacryopinax primogenitus]EJU05264.1 hypothetical protein DACRYDRAFT_113429 [Dacryopinax primogenitus]
MASFPHIDSQDVLPYAYGTAPHAPHLQPDWVDSQVPVATRVAAQGQGSSVPSGSGEVSTQPLYLPHEFDSSIPSHSSHQDQSTSGSSRWTGNHSFSGSGTGTGSSLSVPRPRRGAHIDYTSSESGASFSLGATSNTAAVGGWTMETNISTHTAGSEPHDPRLLNRAGGSADNEAAQSEGSLAGAPIEGDNKSSEININQPPSVIGALDPHHGLIGMERDTYSHATRGSMLSGGLLPPFEHTQELAYIVPPPFSLSTSNEQEDSAFNDHDRVKLREPPPAPRTAPSTTVIPSSATGILTPVSEPHSNAGKREFGSSLPTVEENVPIPDIEDPAAERDLPMQAPRTPPSTNEVPETPSPHQPFTPTEPSAELGDPPLLALRTSYERAAKARDYKFLPRKGEKAPSPVPPSRESSFGALSPRTRYLDEAGKREREQEQEENVTKKGKGRGKKRGMTKSNEESLDAGERAARKEASKSKKPPSASASKGTKPSPPIFSVPAVADQHESEHVDNHDANISVGDAASHHPSTTMSSIVRRSFPLPLLPPPSDIAHLPERMDADVLRTATTDTGLGMLGLTVGSGQRVLVETSSSAPLVEEPEQEPDREESHEPEDAPQDVVGESSRAQPGDSLRKVSASTDRATRDTRWSKSSRDTRGPSQSQRQKPRVVSHPEIDSLDHAPGEEQKEEGEEMHIQGTQELASPSEVPAVTAPRRGAKRLHTPIAGSDEAPAKRYKNARGMATEPRTPNKANQAKKVYSSRRNRHGVDPEEEETEPAPQTEGKEKATSRDDRESIVSGPPKLMEKSASKGIKRRAEKEPSDAESADPKRRRRAVARDARSSEPESVTSRYPRRGQVHEEDGIGAPGSAPGSATTRRVRTTAAARKPVKGSAKKAHVQAVIHEDEEPEEPHPHGTDQLEIAAEEPTPSPVIGAGAPFSRVFAGWSDKCYYPATVTNRVSSGRKAGQFHLDFDDGAILETVAVSSLRAAVLKEGDTIAILKDRKWREGTVMEGAFGTVQKDALVRIRLDQGSQSIEQVAIKSLRIPRNAVADWDDRKLTSDQVVVHAIVKREPEDRRRRASTAGPGGSTSESPVASQRRRGRPMSAVFEGHAFIVTAKEDKTKAELVRQIEQASGQVAEDFGDYFDVTEQHITWKGAERGLIAVWCIAREVSTTPKYLMALALGVPCLGSRFISDVIEKRTTIDKWGPYLLSAGKSDYQGTECSQKVDWRWVEDDDAGRSFMNDIISSPHICRPLQGKRLFFLVSKKDNFLKGRLVDALWAMGAEHVEKTSALSLDVDWNSYDYLYWPDEETSFTLPRNKRAKRVGPNWIKQCLITGLCVPIE